MKKTIILFLVILSFEMCINNITSVREMICTNVTTSLFDADSCYIFTTVSDNISLDNRSSIVNIKEIHVQEAGFNIGWLKKIFQSVTQWKFFKSLGPKFRKIFGIEKKKTPGEIERLIETCKNSSKIFSKTFEDIKSNEEVSAKVSEYLEKVPRGKYNTVKTIKCIKQDADEIRFMMWDGNISKANKIIKSGTETIKLFEYDINSMEEFTQKGENGVEYVYFRIPKYPEYILDGKSDGRVNQSMVFGLPKDFEGNWEKFRAFLIDLFTHPKQLWDEWQFRKELSKFNINSRDVQEIEEYIFAKTEIKYEDSEFFKKEVA